MASPTFHDYSPIPTWPVDIESLGLDILYGPIDPPSGLEGTADPLLVASLGRLRFSLGASQLTYVVGRAPDCDLVLPDSSDLASWKHCELGWDGRHITIKDLASTNGTWTRTTTYCPHSLMGDLHSNYNSTITRVMIWFATAFPGSGASYATVWTKWKIYTLGFEASGVACAPYDPTVSLLSTELLIRNSGMSSVPFRATPTKSYCAGRDRRDLDTSDYPGTPVFIPPPALPVNEESLALALSPKPYTVPLPDFNAPVIVPRTPVRYEVNELIFVGIAYDPNGLPWDHPDIIYRDCVTINPDAELQNGRVPNEILRWSKRYCLPIGLHRGWADFSSIPYGPRLPPSAAQPHHSPASGFFVPVALGFTAKKKAFSSPAKRKRSDEDGGEPTAVKRRQTQTRSGVAMSKREHRSVPKVKPTSRKPPQLRRGRLARPGQERGPPPKPVQDVDTPTVTSHRRPLKRKRDSSESGDQPPKRLAAATGSLHKDSALRTHSDDAPDTTSGLHARRRAASKPTEPARRSARVRDRAATVLQND
ncbi:hypothetical protein PENSPDRAFT_713817 [Peniophora sp. CONT]|nr:hypothetical protein PENSPDRAFT_713817 [Peniophora sp. CONT]